jgi:hypothetical protein
MTGRQVHVKKDWEIGSSVLVIVEIQTRFHFQGRES